MKLLFDNNISYRIIKKIQHLEIESIHVSSTSLKKPAEDIDIWNYAKTNSYTIITFDEDFEELELMNSFPPKVILLKLGNSTTNFIAEYLSKNTSVIIDFIQSDKLGLLKLY